VLGRRPSVTRANARIAQFKDKQYLYFFGCSHRFCCFLLIFMIYSFCFFIVFILIISNLGDFMTAKSLVDTYYSIEQSPELLEIASTTFTVRLGQNHLQMITCLAERFKQSRSGLGASLLEDAIFEAFEALNEDDRLKLSAKADEALKENGFPSWWKFQLDCIHQSVGTDQEQSA